VAVSTTQSPTVETGQEIQSWDWLASVPDVSSSSPRQPNASAPQELLEPGSPASEMQHWPGSTLNSPWVWACLVQRVSRAGTIEVGEGEQDTDSHGNTVASHPNRLLLVDNLAALADQKLNTCTAAAVTAVQSSNDSEEDLLPVPQKHSRYPSARSSCALDSHGNPLHASPTQSFTSMHQLTGPSDRSAETMNNDECL